MQRTFKISNARIFFDISDLLTSLRLQLHLAVCESVNHNLIREETVKLLWISWTGLDVDLICTLS